MTRLSNHATLHVVALSSCSTWMSNDPWPSRRSKKIQAKSKRIMFRDNIIAGKLSSLWDNHTHTYIYNVYIIFIYICHIYLQEVLLSINQAVFQKGWEEAGRNGLCRLHCGWNFPGKLTAWMIHGWGCINPSGACWQPMTEDFSSFEGTEAGKSQTHRHCPLPMNLLKNSPDGDGSIFSQSFNPSMSRPLSFHKFLSLNQCLAPSFRKMIASILILRYHRVNISMTLSQLP
jgi:hypothetical protein